MAGERTDRCLHYTAPNTRHTQGMKAAGRSWAEGEGRGGGGTEFRGGGGGAKLPGRTGVGVRVPETS